MRSAFLGLFFACGETEPSSLPALNGELWCARPFWYRSRATAFRDRFFAYGEIAISPSPALRSAYPTRAGGSPAAPKYLFDILENIAVAITVQILSKIA